MQVELWQETYGRVREKYPDLTGERLIYQTISHLIGFLILDLVETTRSRLNEANVTTLNDVRNHPVSLVSFSQETARKNRQLKRFLYQRLYRHYKVERMRIKAERFLTSLFESYFDNPTLLPFSYQQRFEEHGKERVICDYLAGMTDRYAQDEYKKLFEPFERV